MTITPARIIPERLSERIAAVGLSYSAVARELGVKQPTISRLVKGEQGSTARIDQLARIVRTTPAYLTGETDDPSIDAPALDFRREEVRMASYMRIMPTHYQSALLRMAEGLAQKPSLLELLPDEDALAEMFEALLLTMNRKKPLDEQARLLAQRLPIALSQMQDLLPPQPIVDLDEAPAVPARPTPEAVSS